MGSWVAAVERVARAMASRSEEVDDAARAGEEGAQVAGLVDEQEIRTRLARRVPWWISVASTLLGRDKRCRRRIALA